MLRNSGIEPSGFCIKTNQKAEIAIPLDTSPSQHTFYASLHQTVIIGEIERQAPLGVSQAPQR